MTKILVVRCGLWLIGRDRQRTQESHVGGMNITLAKGVNVEEVSTFHCVSQVVLSSVDLSFWGPLWSLQMPAERRNTM